MKSPTRAFTHLTALALVDRSDTAWKLRSGDLLWMPLLGLFCGLAVAGAYLPLAVFFVPSDIALWLALALQICLGGARVERGFASWCRLWAGPGSEKSEGGGNGELLGMLALVFLVFGRWLLYRPFFPTEVWIVLVGATLLQFAVPLTVGRFLQAPGRGLFSGVPPIGAFIGGGAILFAVVLAVAVRVNGEGEIFFRSGVAVLLALFLVATAVALCGLVTWTLSKSSSDSMLLGLGAPAEIALLLALVLGSYAFM